MHTGNVTELEDTAQYELMRELVRRYSKFEIATPIIPEQPTRDGLTIVSLPCKDFYLLGC